MTAAMTAAMTTAMASAALADRRARQQRRQNNDRNSDCPFGHGTLLAPRRSRCGARKTPIGRKSSARWTRGCDLTDGTAALRRRHDLCRD